VEGGCPGTWRMGLLTLPYPQPSHEPHPPYLAPERRVGENTTTLQKLIRTPETLSTEKLRPHVMAHA